MSSKCQAWCSSQGAHGPAGDFHVLTDRILDTKPLVLVIHIARCVLSHENEGPLAPVACGSRIIKPNRTCTEDKGIATLMEVKKWKLVFPKTNFNSPPVVTCQILFGIEDQEKDGTLNTAYLCIFGNSHLPSKMLLA
jgi:hypothetical protein